MQKDALYKKATSFMNDGMIWLMKILKVYFAKQVLHFNYSDFKIAIRDDLPPLFSNVGQWIMENWFGRLKETGEDKVLEKKIKVCLDIMKKVEDKGLEYFDKESRYNLINKFGPKKCPD